MIRRSKYLKTRRRIWRRRGTIVAYPPITRLTTDSGPTTLESRILLAADSIRQFPVARYLNPSAAIHNIPPADNDTADPCAGCGDGVYFRPVANVQRLVLRDPKPPQRHLQPSRTWLEFLNFWVLLEVLFVTKHPFLISTPTPRC